MQLELYNSPNSINAQHNTVVNRLFALTYQELSVPGYYATSTGKQQRRTSLHGVIFQKTGLFSKPAVRISSIKSRKCLDFELYVFYQKKNLKNSTLDRYLKNIPRWANPKAQHSYTHNVCGLYNTESCKSKFRQENSSRPRIYDSRICRSHTSAHKYQLTLC